MLTTPRETALRALLKVDPESPPADKPKETQAAERKPKKKPAKS